MIALIENAGYIYGTYVITFAVIGGYAWRVIRQGRRLGRRIDDSDKYWT